MNLSSTDAARVEELRTKAAQLKNERQAALNRRDMVEAARIMREDNAITEELQRLVQKYRG